MWNRREIKEYAKEFLSRHYWKAFLVVLLTMFLMGGANDVGQSNNMEQLQDDFDTVLTDQDFTSDSFQTPAMVFDFVNKVVRSPIGVIGLGLAAITSIFFGILLITLGFVAQVGQSRFFLDGFKGDVNISKLFSGFNSDEYIPIVKAQALAWVSIFLFTFLLVVPGIIKAYQYRYVPYLLAEDTSLLPREALDRSKALTIGHKWDIFILDLSFILWDLLGIVTFGLAPLFVAPYVEATNARLYTILASEVVFDNRF